MAAAPPPGAAGLTPGPPPVRRTARRRPLVAVGVWPDREWGYPVEHPYVRRYWSAVMGPGAVGDLMRLIVAARTGRRLPRPRHLHTLAREGLVYVLAGKVLVRATVPPVPALHRRRLAPGLRRELDAGGSVAGWPSASLP